MFDDGMKWWRRCIPVMGLLAVMPMSAGSAECPDLPKEMEAQIDAVTQDMRGAEYCEFRRLYQAQDIVVVLYSVEGPCFDARNMPSGTCGNYHARYMGVLYEGKMLNPVKVGGRDSFSERSAHYDGKYLYLSGVIPGKGDPACCPSHKTERKFEIVNRTVRAVAQP